MVNTIQNEFISIVINSEGAELTSIRTVNDNVEYLWQSDPKYWIRQSPVLFPIVGSVENNKYSFMDKEYELHNHGFGKECEYALIDKGENYLNFKLTYNDDTLKKYPFKFELFIGYTLKENNIITKYTVKNIDEKDMYFSIGAHPGFKCPIDNEGTISINDYYLEFNEKEQIDRIFIHDGLRNGKTSLFMDNENIVLLSHELFYEKAIIMKNLKSNTITLKSNKSNRYVSVKYDGFPYMGIWSPENDAPFVCIEPWYGVTSAKGGSKDIKDKEGIMMLPKGETFECEYTITIG